MATHRGGDRVRLVGRRGGVYTCALCFWGVFRERSARRGWAWPGDSMDLFIQFVGAKWYLFTAVIVLLTDGNNNRGTDPLEAADQARENGVRVYTIGYGSQSLDDFVSALKTHEISYLIDVRSAPYSRFKPEFSKDALETHLRENAIRYIYLGDQLGGQPKDRDCYDDDKVVYARVKEKAFFRAGLERVQAARQSSTPSGSEGGA
mgnify:CR=1 FL=1